MFVIVVCNVDDFDAVLVFVLVVVGEVILVEVGGSFVVVVRNLMVVVESLVEEVVSLIAVVWGLVEDVVSLIVVLVVRGLVEDVVSLIVVLVVGDLVEVVESLVVVGDKSNNDAFLELAVIPYNGVDIKIFPQFV